MQSIGKAEAASKRLKLQQFLNGQLLPDLQALSESHDSRQTDLRSYEQLQTSIKYLKQASCFDLP